MLVYQSCLINVDHLCLCSLYGGLLDSMARVQSVDDKAVFVFVGDTNPVLITLSGWSLFLLLIDIGAMI